jgi:flavin reductase (DIM6/NTAB) family NADH-FMN oxidoreductase RutF
MALQIHAGQGLPWPSASYRSRPPVGFQGKKRSEAIAGARRYCVHLATESESNAPSSPVDRTNILYLGMSVVLISTVNEDENLQHCANVSAFWLGWRCVLGLDASSKTPRNMIRTGQCVLNLPSANKVGAVNRLAKLTGTDPGPPNKAGRGYRCELSRLKTAGLTPVASETEAPPRALQCPIQMEAVVAARHGLGEDSPWRGGLGTFEVRIHRVHAHPDLLMDGYSDRIDPDKWRPLIMSFQEPYGHAPGKLHASTLGHRSPRRATAAPTWSDPGRPDRLPGEGVPA